MKSCVLHVVGLMLLALQLTGRFIVCSPNAAGPSAVSAVEVSTPISSEGFLLVSQRSKIYKIPLPLRQDVPYLSRELEAGQSNASEPTASRSPVAVVWKPEEIQSLAVDCVKQHIYWGMGIFRGKIYRADYDGQNVETVITDVYKYSTSDFTPVNFALDTEKRNIYWFQGRDNNASIVVANLDNIQAGHRTVIDNIMPDLGNGLQGIAVDPQNSTIYWAGKVNGNEDERRQKISSVNVDGTNVQTVFDDIYMEDLLLDRVANPLCYTVEVNESIECKAPGAESKPAFVLAGADRRPTSVVIVGDDIYYGAVGVVDAAHPGIKRSPAVKKVKKDGTGLVTALLFNEPEPFGVRVMVHVPQRCPIVSQRTA